MKSVLFLSAPDAGKELIMINLILFFILIAYLIICCISDIKNKCIYILPSFIFFILGILMSIVYYNNFYNSFSEYIISYFIGVIPSLGFFLISRISKNNIGSGDCIMLFVISGYFHGFHCIGIMLFSLIFSAFYSLFILLRKKGKNYSFPFSPFLLCGTLTYYFLNFLNFT